MKIAGVLMVLAGCSTQAVAQPPPSVAAPAVVAPTRAVLPTGWTTMPAIADAARVAVEAATPGVTTTSTAWADPAAGCYALWLRLRGNRPTTLAGERADLVRALAPFGVATLPPLDGAATSYAHAVAITLPDLAGDAQLTLTRDVHGIVQLDAAACVHNAREPIACRKACLPLVRAMPPAATATGTP